MRFALYMTRLYMLWVFLIWLGLSGLIFSASLVEGMALKSAEAGPGALVWTGFLKTVEFAWLLMPAAGFLSALIAGTMAARRGELIGYYSCGGRSATITKFWFCGSLLWVGFGFVLAEKVLPAAKQELLELDLGPKRAQELTVARRPVEWVSIGDWRIYLPSISNDGTVFQAPQLLEMREGELAFVWGADRLLYQNEKWILQNALRYSMDATPERFESHSINLPISPADLWMIAAPPSLLSRTTLKELIEKRRRVGTDYVPHELALARRIGYPVALLPLLLIMAPLALQSDRKRSVAQAIGIGAIAVGCAFGLEGLFRMLALGRQVTPAWGGWGLTLCGTLSLVLLWAYRHRHQLSE